MKKTFIIALTVWAVMLLLPLSVIGKETEVAEEKVVNVSNEVKSEVKKTFRVLDTNSKKITEMSANDYIFGVVAAEMPALYENEALKAQAVAAYTFALKRAKENSDKDYDITTDYTTDQSFITEEEATKKWGEDAEIYIEKVKKAVEETEGYAITYEHKPILAVYHAVSGGKTSDSKDVWDVELDYLKPVLSEWDKLYEDYISQVSFTAEEIKEKFKNVEFSGETKDYFGKPDYTDSSVVKTVTICGKTFTGEEIRGILNLRSTNFEIDYIEDKFIFTVYGYGHGVGMSQYGADCMAKNGSNFKEILTYYYTDCKVEKIS